MTSPATVARDYLTPTLADIRKWPATVSVPSACLALGISRSSGYQLVTQHQFPVQTIRVGRRVRVVTAALIRLLEAGDA